jgi:diguanylate cyclase (GGDEF)-like protein
MKLGMSFIWKWLITTFLAQVFMGLIFAGIQYVHLTQVALNSLEQVDFEFSQELAKVQTARGGYSRELLVSAVREFYSHQRPLSVWVQAPQGRLYEFGDLGAEGITRELMNIDLLRSFSLPTKDHILWVQYDPNEVFRSRDEMVVFVLGIFLLSAVACALILLSLSKALSARLDDLRMKALDLQAGLIYSRIDVKGRDEISDLGAAFNSMANSIESQMQAMEESHAKSETEKNRLDLLLSSLSSGVAYLDEHFNVLYLNKALATMFRLPFPFLETPRLEQLLMNAGVEREQKKKLNDLVTDYFRSHNVPIDLHLDDGRVFQLRFVIYSDQGHGPNGVMIVDDVSIRKNVEDLRNEVERDALTGVLNRRGFDLTLEARVSRLLQGEVLGVLFLDLDGFKAVNDTLGHKAGDQVLKTSASLLKGATRNSDIVARLGGDEFAIIVSRCGQQLLLNIAERIIESFACDKYLSRIRQNHGLNVSCSIGGAMFPTHANTVAGIVELSDGLMYKAKKAGKNCYRIAGGPEVGVDMHPEDFLL